jgi:hypothetical protein
MASLPIGIVLEIVSSPKVQDAAVKAFDAVYSRIFKSQGKGQVADQATIELKPASPEQQLVIDRLSAIERQLQGMPSDTEMAMAFSALQAELRAGQKKLWQIMAPVLVLNFVFLGIILVRLFGSPAS